MNRVSTAEKLLVTVDQLEEKMEAPADDWLCSLCTEIGTVEAQMISSGIAEAIFPATFLPQWVASKHRNLVRLKFLAELRSRLASYVEPQCLFGQGTVNSLCKSALFHMIRSFHYSE
jgi:hypothetical protein